MTACANSVDIGVSVLPHLAEIPCSLRPGFWGVAMGVTALVVAAPTGLLRVVRVTYPRWRTRRTRTAFWINAAEIITLIGGILFGLGVIQQDAVWTVVGLVMVLSAKYVQKAKLGDDLEGKPWWARSESEEDAGAESDER